MPSPTLRSLLAGLDDTDPDSLDLTIQDGDAAYRLAEDLACGMPEQAQVEYFRSAHQAWRVLNAALGGLLGPRWPKRRPARLLEVGAGHGRLTRFLLPVLGSERLTTIEMDSAAPGRAGPELPGPDLNKSFDAVIALSTYLPENQLESSLTSWLDALNVEGGVLLFITLPSTPRDLVGRTLDRLTRGLARWKHVPRGLWDQDLWVVTLDPRVHWDDGLDLAVDQPIGHLDSCRVQGRGDDRVLYATGWALGGRRPPRGARVELRAGDQVAEIVAETETAGHRPDALEHLGLASGAAVPIAFELRVEAQGAIDPGTMLRIDLVDDLGGPGVSNQNRYVLHAGTLEATERFLQLRQAHYKAAATRSQSENVESGRWGKMRHAWTSWKSRLLG